MASKKRLTNDQTGALLRRILYERHGPPIRAVTYDRVSSDSQVGGTSLETQELDTTDWCADRNIIIVKRYVEPGESGRSDARPQFQAMIREIEVLDVQAVVVAAADRFARDARLHLNEIERFRDLGIVFVSINEPIDYSTANGRHQLIDEANRAENYSNRLSERMRRACLHLARGGYWLGPPPVGYTRPSEERSPLVANEDAPAVRLAFTLYATGQYSYSTLADALNRHGHSVPNIQKGMRVPFNKWNVRELLHQIGYIGKMEYRDAIYEGKHEPIIDQALWDAVQEILQERGAKRATLARGAGTGMLTEILYCEECGARMWIHNGHLKYPYYVCSGRWRRTCTAPGIAQGALEPDVFLLLQRLTLPPDMRDDVLATIETLHAQRQQSAPIVFVDTVALNAKLTRLQDLYINGDITKAKYEEQRQKIENQRPPEQVTTKSYQPPDLRAAARLLDNLHDLVLHAPLVQQRATLRQLFAALWAKNQNGITGVQPRETYFSLIATITAIPFCSSVSRVGSQHTQLQIASLLRTGYKQVYAS